MRNTENQDENEFRELLDQSLPKRDNFSVGDKVSGIAAFITKDTVFVDISGKSEAIMERSELLDESGGLTVKVGDRITAFVVSTAGGEITISKSIGKGQAGQRHLELAHENEIPVIGLVTGEVKGGYSVSISGIKCFCPFSHFDIRPVGDVSKNFNKNFEFKIIQYTERGRNIILSRRELLEEVQRSREDELKKSLREGDTIEGTIISVRDFGIFVDLGGIEALIPRSEISWSRSPDMSEYPVGKKISAKVLTIDWTAKKLSLSLKAAAIDPWSNNLKYERGMTASGRITNIIKSGAFVELEPGIEGFIHVSRMSYTKKTSRPEEAVTIGENVTVRIAEINTDEKKMSLELLTGEGDPWSTADEISLDSAMTATVEASVPAGIRVRLANGMLGFIPNRELLSGEKSDSSKKYQTGGEVKVCVKEIDAAKKNLILSERDAAGMEERKEFQKYSGAAASTAESSLGFLFKSQFEDIKKKIDSKQ